jgi:hypothetical protein
MAPDYFDPATDGWYFGNWGEATEPVPTPFTWDLFRDTYLGVNPTQDCIEAPLDCAFFELFKIAGDKGNCGGISILALALYKYGGYMGFCSPAHFYTGGEDGPDRPDLHRAINIFQARQFSVNGIRNFLDVIDAGNLNNAVIAFQQVKELLGKGDYPVLSIAKGLLGDHAHTVIPYRYEDNPTFPKYLYIWDSNFPYDTHKDHYSSPACKMKINGPTDWIYDPNTYDPNTMSEDKKPYQGADNGWCFAIPMSRILPKARHPLSVGMVLNALMTVFITGSGAAIDQISDDQGRHLYKSEARVHRSRGELEDDPVKRLPGVGRWPWYGQQPRQPLPEVYFLRQPPRSTDRLHLSLRGASYNATYGGAGDMIAIHAESPIHGVDKVTLSMVGTPYQSLLVSPTDTGRKLSIRQSRLGDDGREWRAFEIGNIELRKGAAMTIDVTENFDNIAVSSGDHPIPFDLLVERFSEAGKERATICGLSTTFEEPLVLRPADWRNLREGMIERVKAPGRFHDFGG